MKTKLRNKNGEEEQEYEFPILMESEEIVVLFSEGGLGQSFMLKTLNPLCML